MKNLSHYILKNLYLTFISVLFTIAAFGQSGKGIISGKILTSDGKPAEYVNIGLKGTTLGAIANSKGEYVIKNVTPGNYTLITSFVGLVTREINIEVKENETTIIPEIILQEDAHQLNEVVIQAGKNYVREPSDAINRMEIKNMENPQSVQVINQELMQDKQIQSVGEAIKLMAGVNAFSSSQYSDYVMRGFRTSPGNFAYNGIRGNFYGFDQAALIYNIG